MSEPIVKFFPSKYQHISRNKHNIIPVWGLTSTEDKDQHKQSIFIDAVGREWRKLKWYHALFHNPAKNAKFVYYHCDNKNAGCAFDPKCTGSSEVIVPKKYIAINPDKSQTISILNIYSGSYNYKDFRKTSHFAHFFADVLPVALYCSCVGK